MACPHRGTSFPIVNQRKLNTESSVNAESNSELFVPDFSTKAVSERFISLAMFCMTDDGRGFSKRHTAAGLPVKGPGPKASTYGKGRRLTHVDHDRI